MLYHSNQAVKASQEWERRKPGIVAFLKRRFTADFTLRQATRENWTLSDLMDKWSWHERQAKLMSSNLSGLSAYLNNLKQLDPEGDSS